MKKKTSKDFSIFKIRYYADEKLLKKWHSNRDSALPLQHSERARNYNDFFWKFVEVVTNKSSNIWHNEYMFGSKDCATEELSDYGIFISDQEGWYTYLIPIERQDLANWIIDNVNLPMKQLRKFSMYVPNFIGQRTWQRDDCKKYMDEQKLKKK